MGEEVMCDLVGDDYLMAAFPLMAHKEAAVLEAVVEWITAGVGREEGREERLPREIRYGLLTATQLEEVGWRAEEMVGEGLGARLRALANEAPLALQQLPAAAWEGQEGGLLCSRAFEPRKGPPSWRIADSKEFFCLRPDPPLQELLGVPMFTDVTVTWNVVMPEVYRPTWNQTDGECKEMVSKLTNSSCSM